MTAVFERAKKIHELDSAATVIGISVDKFYNITHQVLSVTIKCPKGHTTHQHAVNGTE
jgi:hypothetical protein